MFVSIFSHSSYTFKIEQIDINIPYSIIHRNNFQRYHQNIFLNIQHLTHGQSENSTNNNLPHYPTTQCSNNHFPILIPPIPYPTQIRSNPYPKYTKDHNSNNMNNPSSVNYQTDNIFNQPKENLNSGVRCNEGMT